MSTNTRSLMSLSWRRAVVDLKEFVRSRESMIFIFAFPIMMLALFAAILGGSEIYDGVKFEQYFLAGMIASGIFFTGFQSLAIWLSTDRDADVLKRVYGSPLPPVAFFMGKVIQVLVVSFAQIALLLLVARFMYGIPMPADPSKWLTFTWVFILGTAASTTLGIALSTVIKRGKASSAITTPIVLVLQFISGVFFVFTQLPSTLQHVAEVFPLKWLAQGLRAVFLPDNYVAAEARGSWELGTVAIMLAAWFIVGLIVSIKHFRWMRPADR